MTTHQRQRHCVHQGRWHLERKRALAFGKMRWDDATRTTTARGTNVRSSEPDEAPRWTSLSSSSWSSTLRAARHMWLSWATSLWVGLSGEGVGTGTMAASLMSSYAAQAESRGEMSHEHMALRSCRRGDGCVWSGRRHVLHGGNGRMRWRHHRPCMRRSNCSGLWRRTLEARRRGRTVNYVFCPDVDTDTGWLDERG